MQREVKNGVNSKNVCHSLIQGYQCSISSLKTQRIKLYKLQFCFLNVGEKSGHLILREEHRLRMLKEGGAEKKWWALQDPSDNHVMRILMSSISR